MILVIACYNAVILHIMTAYQACVMRMTDWLSSARALGLFFFYYYSIIIDLFACFLFDLFFLMFGVYKELNSVMF